MNKLFIVLWFRFFIFKISDIINFMGLMRRLCVRFLVKFLVESKFLINVSNYYDVRDRIVL